MNFRQTRQPGDERLIVQFYTDAVEDADRSGIEGRPVYKDVDFVRIVVPAADWAPTGEEHISLVSPEYQQRFAYEYQQFKSTKKETSDGTPLKMWPAISISQLKELQHFGIATVEQLAGIEGKELRLNPWIEPHKNRAVQWLASLADNSAVLRLSAEIDSLKSQVAFLEEEKAELIAIVRNSAQAVQSPKKRLNTKTDEQP